MVIPRICCWPRNTEFHWFLHIKFLSTPKVLRDCIGGIFCAKSSHTTARVTGRSYLKMDVAPSARRRVCFLYGLLLISLLLCVNRADAEPGDPTGNLNLSPFDQWRSAYECLQKISDSCPEKYKLTDAGWLNVTDADAENFCNGGCAESTKAVLTCISLVKLDYKFVNKATVQDVNYFITKGCVSGFNGSTVVPSNARGMIVSRITLFVTILPILFILSL